MIASNVLNSLRFFSYILELVDLSPLSFFCPDNLILLFPLNILCYFKGIFRLSLADDASQSILHWLIDPMEAAPQIEKNVGVRSDNKLYWGIKLDFVKSWACG